MSEQRSITLVASVNSYTGYGQHAIQIVRHLQKAGYSVSIRPIKTTSPWNTTIPEDISRLCVSGVQDGEWELLLSPVGMVPTPGKKTINFTMWEATRLPAQFVRHCNASELVVVPCQWNADCFSASGVNAPLQVVPLGVDTNVFKKRPFPGGSTFTFGAGGWFENGRNRKGLDQVVNWFQKAFPNKDENVKLMIKTLPSKTKMEIPDDPRIVLVNEFLEVDQLANWFSSINCFISSGVGAWELMAQQAMTTGRPVIAAQYGGITEYFDESVGIVCAHRMVPAQDRWKDCGHWVEMCEDAVIAAMRWCVSNPQEVASLGALAEERAKRFTWESSCKKLIATLEGLKALNPTSKIGLHSLSKKPQTLTIQRWGAYGDVILATSIASKLRKHGYRIRFATQRCCIDPLQNHPDIDEFTVLKGRNVIGQADVNLDEVYERSPHRKTVPIGKIYQDSATEQLANIGVEFKEWSNTFARLSVAEKEREKAEAAFKHLPRPWVVVCPRSNFWNTKTVSIQSWMEAKQLLPDTTMIWTGTDAAPPGYHSAQCKTFRGVMSVIACADMVIGVDTGPMHVALALGKPSVVVKQAFDPDLTMSTMQRDYSVLDCGLECSNCQMQKCPKNPTNPPCMHISGERIASAIQEKLDSIYGNKVSAIIPVYKPDLDRLARCIRHTRFQVHEIVIAVDGFKTDLSGVPGIGECKVIPFSGTRLGYGKTCARAIHGSSGRNLLLLNDDVFLRPDAVSKMLECSKPGVGVVGCRLWYPDGTIQHGGSVRGPGDFGWGHLDHLKRIPTVTKPTEMEFVTFASAMVRREAYFEVNGFDEDYDCYCEDNDLCMQVKRAGWSVWYQPLAEGIHLESQTTKKVGKKELGKAGYAKFLQKWGWFFER